MTILAQLNDCHCCSDVRSLVQKKNRNSKKLQAVFNDLSLMIGVQQSSVVESIRTWLRERRVDRMLRVVGQGCLTPPLRILNVPM